MKYGCADNIPQNAGVLDRPKITYPRQSEAERIADAQYSAARAAEDAAQQADWEAYAAEWGY